MKAEVADCRVSIHQPSYFPWLGWMHKIKESDLFVLMDEVQLSDSAFQHRNIFLTSQGESKYLTIPFVKKGYKDKYIKDLELNEQVKWQVKHANFIRENYRKHPNFDEVYSFIEPIFTNQYGMLIDVLIDSIKLSLKAMKINTELILQSSLDYDRNTKASDLVLDLVKATNCSTYLSGQGAKSYLQQEDFIKEGIQLDFQEFTHPVYKQFKFEEFIPGLASVDLFMNLGLEKASLIID